MSLNSLQDDMSRRAASMAAMANRSTNPQEIQAIQKSLVDGVQSGSIQPYVGIPLIQELTNKLTEVKAQMAQTMAGAGIPQGPQSAPIAQQVMQQAAQESQGLGSLPSNLPQQYAGGGIIAFEDGGEVKRFYEGDLVNDRFKYTSSYYQNPQTPAPAKIDPLSIQAQVEQYKQLMAGIPKGASQTEYEEYLKNRSGDAEAAKQQDLNLALAQFGLNLATGKSPRALENLGEAGIKTLPAVQEAYRQRRLADETALKGRAELDRMSRAEQLEALKGGVGLYGKEREIAAEAEKAELNRQNNLAIARAQKEHPKPTDLGTFINDYVFYEKQKGNPKTEEALRVEAYAKAPMLLIKQDAIAANRAIAGGAQNVQQRGQDINALTTGIKEFNDLPFRDPAKKAYKAAVNLDKENAAKGIPSNEAEKVRNDWIKRNTPSLTPGAPSPAPNAPAPVVNPSAPKAVAPSISDVKGAPAGSKIGAYTTNGWEVRDKNGELIGYAGSK